MSENHDDRATVRSMLDVIGLEPSAEEFEIIAEAYPLLRERVARLYEMPDVRYEAPGVIFDPQPAFADWSS